MPYKNKEDRKENKRKNYNKNKIEKICAWDDCNKPLPTSRNKFCSDWCSDRFFTRKIRLEKQKLRELDSRTKNCKYEECGKELPKGVHSQKQYCPDTDCAYKQNQLEQRRKRAKVKAAKEIVMDICKNDNCDEPFIHHPRKKYCCKECTKDQNLRNSDKKRAARIAEYKDAKDNAIKANGNKKDIFVSSEYLGVRFPSKPRKKVKFEIKKFSAKWLQKLWDERVA